MKHIMELVVLAGFAAYIYTYFSTNAMVVTAVVAAGTSIYLKSPRAAIGICIGAVIFQMGSALLEQNPLMMTDIPAANLAPQIDTIQPKDPVSIHQRIVMNKRTESFENKLDNVTGVLESPQILDSLHLTDLTPSEMGGSHKTVPVGVMRTEPIRTPAEATLPPIDTPDKAPMPNPYLQNGPDYKGILTALVNKGTAMFTGQPASDVTAVNNGAGRDYD